MTDKAYEIAVSRSQEIADRLGVLRAEMTALDAERAALDGFIQTWHKLMGEPPKALTSYASQPTAAQNPKKEEVARIAKSQMELTERPIPRKELLRLLEIEGMPIVGADPQKALSTMMWRMRDQFVLLKGFGYWLADKPYSAARYNPNDPKPDELQSRLEQMLQ